MHNGTTHQETETQSTTEQVQMTAEELKAKGEAYFSQAKEAIAERPVASMMVGLGIGLGVGLLLGGSSRRRPAPGWTDQVSDWGSRTATSAESIGRQIVDSVADQLPNAISKYLG